MVVQWIIISTNSTATSSNVSNRERPYDTAYYWLFNYYMLLLTCWIVIKFPLESIYSRLRTDHLLWILGSVWSDILLQYEIFPPGATVDIIVLGEIEGKNTTKATFFVFWIEEQLAEMVSRPGIENPRRPSNNKFCAICLTSSTFYTLPRISTRGC